MATRNLVINDPVGIHARPAAMFAQAVTASGQTVTIAKEGGNAVPAGSILSIMGLSSYRNILIQGRTGTELCMRPASYLIDSKCFQPQIC